MQQLSKEASGTKLKYSRIGSRVFVPYNFDTINLENIRTACYTRINHDWGMFCDILASEQGLSCKIITQLPKLNLIHCRFIPENLLDVYQLIRHKEIVSKINLSKRGISQSTFPAPSSVIGPAPKRIKSDHQHHPPISLSASKMIKLGKLIKNETIPRRLVSFNLLVMCWEEDTETINFKVEKEEFAAEAYRKCVKAYTSCSTFGAKTFVIKKYDAVRANFKRYQDAGKKMLHRRRAS